MTHNHGILIGALLSASLAACSPNKGNDDHGGSGANGTGSSGGTAGSGGSSGAGGSGDRRGSPPY